MISIYLVLAEVFLALLWVWFDGVSTLLPLGWADLAVLSGELVALDEPEDLIDVPADVWVVHGDVLDDAIWVDDGSASEGVASLWHVEAVHLADLATEVANEWVADWSEAALLPVSLGPGEVAENGVNGHAEDLAVDSLELGVGLAEGDDLCWAHEGEVEWVREEDDPLALASLEANLLEVKVWEDSLADEFWSLLANPGNTAWASFAPPAWAEPWAVAVWTASSAALFVLFAHCLK